MCRSCDFREKINSDPKSWDDIESLKRWKEYIDKNGISNLDMFSPFSIFAVSNIKKDTKNERIYETGETENLRMVQK